MIQRLGRARRDRRVLLACAFLALALAIVLPVRATFGAGNDQDLQDAREQLENQLPALFDRLEGIDQLADALPLSSLDPADALNLGDIFQDADAGLESLKDKLADAGDIGDPAELESFLDGLDLTYDDADHASVSLDVDDVEVTKTGSGDTAVVDIELTVAALATVDIPIDFATGIVDLLAADGDGTFPVELSATTNTLHLRFEKALLSSPTPTQALYLVTTPATPTITLSASSADADLLDLDTTFGFSAISVDGDISFDIDYVLSIFDPDDDDQAGTGSTGDGKITADEWTSIATDDLVFGGLVDDDATDAVSAEIRLDSDLLSGDPDLTITYADESLVDASPPVIDLDEDSPLNDLRNFSAAEALGALMRLVSMLDGLQNTGSLDIDLPFLNGYDDLNDLTDSNSGSFSDAVRIAKKLEDAISDPDTDGDGIPNSDGALHPDLTKVVDDPATDINEIGRPAFETAQDLETLLENTAILGVTPTIAFNDDDPAHRRLEFSFELSDEAFQSISLGLGDIDVLSAIALDDGDSTLQIHGGYALDLGFALDLTPQPREDGAGIGSCTDGIDNGAPDADVDGTTNEDDGAPTGADAADPDCAGTQTLEQRVQIDVSAPQELSATFGVLADDFDASARIGILEASIDGGTLLIGSGTGEDGSGDTSTCHDGLDNDSADDDGDGADMADADCRAALGADVADPDAGSGGDGWLTIEELFNALGTSLTTKLTAKVEGEIPVEATLGSTSLGGGTIEISGDQLTDEPITDALQLVESIDIDATDLEASDLFSFSPCSNDEDDDGDGTVNDGCGTTPPDDKSEASSSALLDKLFDTLRAVSAQLEDGGLIPAGSLDTPLPLIGASFNDLVDFAETITAIADTAENPAESALTLPGGGDPCAGSDDDDFDGAVNDGCPTVDGSGGGLPEAGEECANSTSDDDASHVTQHADDVVNDGCPAVAPSLQRLADVLAGHLERLLDAVGDPDDTDATVELAYDDATKDLELILDVDFQRTLATSLTLDLPEPIGSLVSLDALPADAVELVLSADLDLGFGINLDDFTPYILGNSVLDLSADASVEDIFFDVGIGSLSVSVGQETPTPEDSGAGQCDAGNAVDDDGDGYVNDGCPAQADPEAGADCGDKADSDGDSVADDGCGDDNPDEDGSRPEAGAECIDTDGEENDDTVSDGGDPPAQVADDGTADDGCPDDPEAASSGTGDPEGDEGEGDDPAECAIEDVDSDDTDAFINDGCPARADRARFFLGAGVQIDVGTDGGDDDQKYTFGDGGDLSFDVDFHGADDSPAWCDAVEFTAGPNTVGPAVAAGDKDVCAVLPLFATIGGVEQAIRPDGGDPADHHVLFAVADVTTLDPSTFSVHYDTSKLWDFIQQEVLDLLLVNTGLDQLFDMLQSLLESDLFSFAVPLIGGQTATAADIVDRLKSSVGDAILSQTSNGTANPLQGLGSVTDVQNVLNNIKTEILSQLENPDGDNATNDGFDVPGDFQIQLLCGETPAPCDTGAENDPANPAVAEHDGDADADNNCEDPAATDEDGDGTNNDGCTGVPAVADSAGDVSDVRIRFTLTDTIDLGEQSLDFDIGIPGLQLTTEGAAINGEVKLSFAFGIGISKAEGFYFLTNDLAGNPAAEIDLQATVGISEDPADPAQLHGQLGFLDVDIVDGDPVAACADLPSADEPCRRTNADTNHPIHDEQDAPSSLTARFAVDLVDPGPTDDGRLTLDELSLGPDFGDLIRFGFRADADVNLHIETGFPGGSGLPRLIGDLALEWEFRIGDLPEDNTAPVADLAALTADRSKLEPKDDTGPSNLNIYLDNVGLDAGSFVSDFLAPIFKDIKRFTDPLQPVIDTVKACIPVLTDLAGECQNLLTLSESLGLVENVEVIEIIISIIEFANELGGYESDGSIVIPIGDGQFDLVGSKLQDGVLAQSEAQSAYAASENINGLAPLTGALSDGLAAAGFNGSSSIGDSATLGSGCPSSGIASVLCGINVRLPFLEEPGKLLGVLFGQDVDLIVWEPPQMKFGFSYAQKFGPIWAVPPVFLEIGGSVEFTINFGIGYSTKGFRLWATNPDSGPSALLQGLFLVDKHPLNGGADLNELQLRGELFANAQVSVLIFSAGAGGSIFMTIGIDLQDPNGDGRLEYQEAADIINSTGNVLCIFNLNGNFGVRVFVFAEVDLFFWSQRWELTLAEIILYEFKIECEPLPDPVLAHGDGTTLVLHVGDKRYLRDPEEFASSPYVEGAGSSAFTSSPDGTPDNSVGYDQIDEQYKVVRTATGVQISSLGVTQTYDGAWTKIVGDAGDGEDVIALTDGKVEGQPQPLAFDIESDLSGGDGPDQLTGSTVKDTLDGDDGEDVLNGRDGANTMSGGDDKDVIESGKGDDHLYGGSGDDRISAGPGADHVEGNDGNDQIDGGRSAKGAADGGDTIFGDNRNGDGTPQADTDGTDDTDTIDAGDGDDHVYPSGGADLVNGGPGDDTIIDGGDDVECGDPNDGEDDVLTGGPGADTIEAGNGDDIVIGGNLVAGQADTGDKKLDGGNDCDQVWGDNVNRTDGGALFGVDGSVGGKDTISGGDGDDSLHGQMGDDTIHGDDPADDDSGATASNSDGVDTIYGDESDSVPQGADDAFGDGANDTIFGAGGNDDLVGNGGDDHVYGEDGYDYLLGDSGSVTNTADRATDTVTFSGGAGNDDLHGGGGNDHLYGQGGRDDVYGDGGNDVGFGDGGGNSGPDGNDLMRGGVGEDTMFGNNGADDLFGEQGDDHLGGGSPSSTEPDSGLGADDGVGTADSTDDPTGEDFQDELLGGSGDDVMAGDNVDLATDPVTLLAEASIGLADLLYGEAGQDTMYGENGDDHIFGGLDADHAEGGDDADRIRGEQGQDDLIGGTTEPADGFTTGHQPDTSDDIRGGDDHDVIAGDNARIDRLGVYDDLGPSRGVSHVERRVITLYDVATVASPASRVADVGFSGGEVIHGDDGHDIIYGQGGVDELHGDALDDYLEGGNGADTMYGEAGQDDLIGGTGRTKSDVPASATDGRVDDADILNGGDGADGVAAGDDYDVEMGDNATIIRPDDATKPGLQWDVNTFNASIKRSVFLYDVATVTNPVDVDTNGADTMRGEADADLMYGQGDGDDMLGGGGDDHMQGNDGADEMFGQHGNDDMLGGTGAINFDPPTGADGRRDVGEVGMSGGPGFDWMAGDNAVIRRVLDQNGAWVPSTYNGGVEHLRIWLRDVNSASQAIVSGGDVMFGDADDDVMYGQANGDDAGPDINDVLHGNSGDDYQEGNAGADIVLGYDGQDDQIGGTGLINDDPSTGTNGRWDRGDTIEGGNHADFQLGDNGKIVRPLDGAGHWTYFVEYNPTTVKRVASRFDVAGAATAFGGDVMNGDAGDDYQWGQDGNDVMHGNDDNDDMYGELGNDTMFGDRGEDAMLGDRGKITDTKLTSDTPGATFDTQGPAFFKYVGLVKGQLDRRVTLTDDGDGTPFPSMGYSVGGADKMRGGPGHDSMHGAFGDDLMNGDSGGDFMFGADGADVMWGGRGPDPLSGDPADTPTAEDGTGVAGPASIRGKNDRFVDILFGGYGGTQNDEVLAADILDYLPRPTANGFQGDPAVWFEMTSLNDADPANDQYHQGVDWMYGGFNRDVMEGDVGKNGPDFGDRLIDWLGAYNLYTRCNASYGDDGDIRQHSPSMQNLLLTLAYGSGAGTSAQDVNTPNTSGWRELALVYPGDKLNSGKAFPTTPGHYQQISCAPGAAAK